MDKLPEGELITDSITKHMDRRFINSLDLIGQGTIWLTVDKVVKVDKLVYDNKQVEMNAILMYFKGTDKPLKLNNTNIRAIAERFNTTVTDEWKGQKIPFYAEEGTYFGKPGHAVRVDKNAKPKGKD